MSLDSIKDAQDRLRDDRAFQRDQNRNGPADGLEEDNDRADMPRAMYCRKHGCPCEDDCPTECYLLA